MSLPASYFEEMYGKSDDPWEFGSRWYESRKRQVTLASLQAERYRSAFEPGCSIGTLSADLAPRVDHLVIMDISTRALELARAGVPDRVETQLGQVPDAWPHGFFDLVIVSELAYYLEAEECAVLAEKACASADELVAVHWTHPVDDYPLSGEEVHAIFAEAAATEGLHPAVHHAEPDFLLDSWCRDGESVASRSGLVEP